MVETPSAQVFVAKHGKDSKYRLTYTNQQGMPLWWNADKMAFTSNSAHATLFDWGDIQQQGKIASKHMLKDSQFMIEEPQLMIDAYTVILWNGDDYESNWHLHRRLRFGNGRSL